MSAALQFETRWQGRLIGLQRHAAGAVVDVDGESVDVVAGGVVVAGVFRAVAFEAVALSSGPLQVVVSDPAQLAAAHAEPVFDLRWWRTASMIMIVAVGGLLALHLTPRRTTIDDDDVGRGQRTIARVAVVEKPPRPRTAPPTKTAMKTPMKPSTPSAAAAQALKPEGASMRTAVKRDANRARAMEALTMLGLTGTTATAGVFGAANDIDTALNQLNGSGMANAGPGLGTRGLGGGGTGTTIGLGVLGSGTDPGKRPGVDIGGGADARGKRGVVVHSERVVHAGALDRAEIQRVMDRAMSRIRYCYERALTSDADLDGKLTTLFVIGATGDVINTTRLQSTVTSEVDACVLRVIRSLKFPTPKGGGQVTVTYPFIFTAH